MVNKQALADATDNYLNDLSPNLLYHCKAHTYDIVLPAALRLGALESLSDKEMELIEIAAAFHDMGFVKRYNDNESVGAQFAKDFMKAQGYRDADIKLVVDAILNTNMHKDPKSTFEAIIRDADLSYFGSTIHTFLKWNYRLQQEALLFDESFLREAAIDTKIWNVRTIEFMNEHQWFTKSAKQLYEKNKQDNISFLKTNIVNHLPGLCNLDIHSDSYAIIGSGPLAAHGLRENNDLDIIVTNDCWNKLLKKYSPKLQGTNHNLFKLGNIELTNFWFGMDINKLIKDSENINGFNYVNLQSTLLWKKKMNRDEDKEDIKLIEVYMKK